MCVIYTFIYFNAPKVSLSFVITKKKNKKITNINFFVSFYNIFYFDKTEKEKQQKGLLLKDRQFLSFFTEENAKKMLII